jgi:hypothetical protein
VNESWIKGGRGVILLTEFNRNWKASAVDEGGRPAGQELPAGVRVLEYRQGRMSTAACRRAADSPTANLGSRTTAVAGQCWRTRTA